MPNLEVPEQSELARYIDQADIAYRKNQVAESAKLLEQAYLLLVQSKVTDGPEFRHCVKTLTKIYVQTRQPQKALTYIRLLLQFDDSMDTKRVYISILAAIAANHESQGNREESELAYKKALEEATLLLPAHDPLLAKLNNECVDLFRRTVKSRPLTAIEQNVVLTRLPTDVVEIPEEEKEALKAAQPVLVVDDRPRGRKKKIAPAALLQAIVYSQALWITITLVIFACLIKAGISVPTMQSGPAAVSVVQQLEGQQFSSCDGKASFSIGSKDQCSIVGPKFNGQASYILIDNGLPDFNKVFVGHLKKSELWYQINKDGVTDSQKTLMYSSNAAELNVVKQMWWYADFAQRWYTRYHSYPSSAEKCLYRDKNFAFTNAFTLKPDKAAIIPLKHMAGDPSLSERSADNMPAPEWKAGGIYCINIDGNRFFIHGFDRHGHPLTASGNERYFVIECKDGTDLTRAQLFKEKNDSTSTLPENNLRVFVCTRPEQESTIKYLRSVSCIVCWLALILGILLSLSAFRVGQSKIARAGALIFSSICALSLILWYVLANS